MGYIKLDQRLPQVDNNVNSFWYNAEVGPGFKGAGPGCTGIGSRGQPLYGYALFTPGDIFQFYTNQNIQRFIGSFNSGLPSVQLAATRGDFGVDLTNNNEFRLCRLQQCPDFATNRQGIARDARRNLRNLTAIWTASARGTRWRRSSRTTAGTQYGASRTTAPTPKATSCRRAHRRLPMAQSRSCAPARRCRRHSVCSSKSRCRSATA